MVISLSSSSLPPYNKWKRIINLIITILTAIAGTFAVQSCITLQCAA